MSSPSAHLTVPLVPARTGGQFLFDWLGKWEVKLRAKPNWILQTWVYSSIAVVGWLDYVLPWEVNMALAYALIIVLASWFGDSKMGLLAALISAVVAYWVNLPQHPYQTVIGVLLANLGRVVFFICMAICLGAMRRRREADAERIRMFEEMRVLEREIVRVSEHEQQRIGQDLHDGLCQQLAAISCAAHALAEDLQAKSNPDAADAIKIEEALKQTVREARSMARGIFPVHVDSCGLSAAIHDMVSTVQRLTGLTIVAPDSADVQVGDPEVAMHLYRIAQEAVANAVRHSGGTRVELSLVSTPEFMELRVDDNGAGMNATRDSRSDGMGLRTMKYRARAVGAELFIEPRAEGGTSLRCKVPLSPNVSTNDNDNS